MIFRTLATFTVAVFICSAAEPRLRMEHPTARNRAPSACGSARGGRAATSRADS